MKYAIITLAMLSAPTAAAHPDADVEACMNFANFGSAIAEARDAGYSQADVMNIILKTDLWKTRPQFAYRVVDEVFMSELPPAELKAVAFTNCMAIMADE